MKQDNFILLPYRSTTITAIRLLEPYADSYFPHGRLCLEDVAELLVEGIIHSRAMSRQYWRKRTAKDLVAGTIARVLAKYELSAVVLKNIEIIMADVIIQIDEMLDLYIPYNTWQVFTIARYYDELTLTNEGDYRILKFHTENPNWKPTLEEPEEVVLKSRQNLT